MARIRAPGDTVVGAGVLLAPRLVATCAHVVGDALGYDDVPDLAPDAELEVDLPFAPDGPLRRATVWRWWPPASDGTGDVALLQLDAAVGVAVPSTRRVPEPWGRPFRTAGFPPGREDGVWAAGVLRREQGSGWIQLSGAEEIGPGFSGAPILDECGDAVIAMAVAADRGDGPARSAYAIPIARVLAQAPQLLVNPYRGLAAFDEAHREFFFGREDELARALQVLDRDGLVVLVGGSGAGKSSLLTAGVLPEARVRGLRPARVRLAGVASRPAVITAFAAALTEAVAPDPSGRTRAVRTPDAVERWTLRDWSRVLSARPGDRTVVAGAVGPVGIGDARAVASGRLFVAVDQFEDLAFSSPPAAHTALEVIGLLVALGVRVGVTARWATFDDLLDGRSAPVVQRALVGVLPLDRAHLRAAVAEPAARVPGPSFDPGLVARIVDDAGDEPGRLPLVAVLLAELWDAADDGRLTIEAYARVGTVQGALAAAAEREWTAIPVGRRARARALLLAMTRPTETGFVRRPLPLAPLAPGQRRVLEALAAARLVVISPGAAEDVAELAHQSLIDRWPRLQRWLQADDAFLRWRAGLQAGVAAWAPTHDRDVLLRGAALDVAAGWATERAGDLRAPEQEFIAAGLSRRRRERRLRRATLAVVVVLGVSAGSLLAAGLDAPGDGLCGTGSAISAPVAPAPP
ncbi:trypsin-like peptidase domain-containing protein [Actinomycetospora corticicola]|uniref:Novel STAND NTPase 1 domain-containing protein n=1 Tax=Actinomycetospora corticicola TaxID=663602 RepID=A0A7Y9DS68_9PSEU|nr:hypothetical protein [Actinomycetospora corticicola]